MGEVSSLAEYQCKVVRGVHIRVIQFPWKKRKKETDHTSGEIVAAASKATLCSFSVFHPWYKKRLEVTLLLSRGRGQSTCEVINLVGRHNSPPQIKIRCWKIFFFFLLVQHALQHLKKGFAVVTSPPGPPIAALKPQMLMEQKSSAQLKRKKDLWSPFIPKNLPC